MVTTCDVTCADKNHAVCLNSTFNALKNYMTEISFCLITISALGDHRGHQK